MMTGTPRPRCPDMTDTDPVIRTFQCVLDAGHSGSHVPYVPPTVDEWRALRAEMAGMRGFFGLARESADPCPGCGL